MTVIENLQVDNIIISRQKESYENYEAVIEIVKEKNVNVIIAEKGDEILIDKSSSFKILYPMESLVHSDINNNSIVAKFVCNGVRVLFTRGHRGRSGKEHSKII